MSRFPRVTSILSVSCKLKILNFHYKVIDCSPFPSSYISKGNESNQIIKSSFTRGICVLKTSKLNFEDLDFKLSLFSPAYSTNIDAIFLL